MGFAGYKRLGWVPQDWVWFGLVPQDRVGFGSVPQGWVGFSSTRLGWVELHKVGLGSVPQGWVACVNFAEIPPAKLFELVPSNWVYAKFLLQENR